MTKSLIEQRKMNQNGYNEDRGKLRITNKLRALYRQKARSTEINQPFLQEKRRSASLITAHPSKHLPGKELRDHVFLNRPKSIPPGGGGAIQNEKQKIALTVFVHDGI